MLKLWQFYEISGRSTFCLVRYPDSPYTYEVEVRWDEKKGKIVVTAAKLERGSRIVSDGFLEV